MKQYNIRLTGRSPLIMHGQNLDFEEAVSKWQRSPAAKKTPKGDDRHPAFKWIGYLYHDGENAVIPTDNLMTTFREGGTMVSSGGKTTFKAQTQSGARVVTPATLLVGGKPCSVKRILSMCGELDFTAHRKAVSEAGFDLLLKGCKVGMARHTRVRPYFADWSCEFRLDVWDPTLTLEVLQQVWDNAGAFKGLCDWRPGSPKSGQYGTFDAEIRLVK